MKRVPLARVLVSRHIGVRIIIIHGVLPPVNVVQLGVNGKLVNVYRVEVNFVRTNISALILNSTTTITVNKTSN